MFAPGGPYSIVVRPTVLLVQLLPINAEAGSSFVRLRNAGAVGATPNWGRPTIARDTLLHRSIYRAFDEAWTGIASRGSPQPSSIATEAARLKLANIVLSLAADDARDIEALKSGALLAYGDGNSAAGGRALIARIL